jgi:tRNA threonylcarbamoyladenosine biosynthesis protein TsaB
MTVLAIESATLFGGVALVSDQEVIAEHNLNVRVTLSERLMPAIQSLLSEARVSLNMLDGIAVSIGPGSFTGLRIGLSTAKGLCFANGFPLVAVPTLEATAARIPYARFPVCPMLDARKKEVYAGLYDLSEGTVHPIRSPRAIALENMLAELEGPTIFAGDGAGIFRERISETLGEQAHFVAPDVAHPSAAAVGRLGLSNLAAGKISDVFTTEPTYLRKSEAEIAREKRRGRA